MTRQAENKAQQVVPEAVASFQKLVGEIFRTNGTLLSTADDLAGDLDINPARWQFLMAVRHQAMTVSQASRRIGGTRQTARSTANKLRDKGLIEFTENPDHRRSPLVSLTEEGRKMRDLLLTRQAELTSLFLREVDISPAEIERMTEQLREMRRAAEKFQE